jgi:hypothetical protein
MIKKMSVLLAFVALLFAEFALAQSSAVVTSLTGTANVQTGAGPAHALRLGDQVQQGDTVSTGTASALVLKFDDGEVTALTQNSRMTITAYQYEPASGTGNILLSLVTGGMRAITGLIGGNHPERVAYRAATATIGIRGTDVAIATDGADVVVTVNKGAIVVTFGGIDYPLNAGQTGYLHGTTFTYGPPAPRNAVLTRLRRDQSARHDRRDKHCACDSDAVFGHKHREHRDGDQRAGGQRWR